MALLKSSSHTLISSNVWRFWLSINNPASLPVPISGELSLNYPYDWLAETDISWKFIESITHDCKLWLLTRLDCNDVPLDLIKDSATFAYMTLPSNWSQQTLQRAAISDYQREKCLLYAKFILTLFIMDDIVEGLVNNNQYEMFIEEIALSTYKIFTLQYHTHELLLSDLQSCKSELRNPAIHQKHTLWHDIANELQSTPFKHTSEQTEILASLMYNQWDCHTWVGRNGQCHKMSVEGQTFFRFHTSGVMASFEAALLIDNIMVSHNLRKRKYWERFSLAISRIIQYSNDIFSLEREWKEQQLDNAVLVRVKESCSLEDAIKICCEEHDQELAMLKDIICYLNSKDIGIEIGQVEASLIIAVNAGAVFAGHSLQAQMLMKRYTGFQYEIIRKIIPPASTAN